MRFIIRDKIRTYSDSDELTTYNNDLNNVGLVEKLLDHNLDTSKDTPGAK